MVPTRTKNEIAQSVSLRNDDHALFDSRVDRTAGVGSLLSLDEHHHERAAASAARTLNRIVQRAMDLFVSVLLLAALFPIFLVIALLIKMDSAGPVLFVQRRVGFKGKEFSLFKFRSMARDAELRRPMLDCHNEQDGPLFKMRDDPRVTRVGRVLRKYSLDELPQLINVVKGEMSLVGPRPALPKEVAQYTPRQRGRLDVSPGLTGLWQVSGRADLPFDRAIELDLYYVTHQSLWLNLRIIMRTLPAVVSARGAY